jgi:hypothetical protein
MPRARHRAYRAPRMGYRAARGRAIAAERRERGRQIATAATATAAFWPSTSPSTYEDMIGYALWPRDYERQFWSRGPRDIIQAMTAPTVAYASAGLNGRQGRVRTMPPTETSDASHAACIERAREHAVRPLDRIPETIGLSEAQRQKLDALRAAVGEAIARETAACRAALPATQPERLRAMVDALWAMRYAEIHVRTALQAFHDSLDDNQKAELRDEPQTTGSNAETTAAGPAAVCSEAIAAGQNPFGPIDRWLRLNEDQRKSFQMLYGASMQMAKYLMSACPTETPATPLARLDAAGDRIMSLLHAAMTIEPMLNEFYGKLSDRQRARFNMAAR